MLPLNSWTFIIHFHSVQNIILPSEHLHMHQTVIISIMIMRPLPHIHSKEHLGVIRCKALLRKMPYMEWCSSDFSVLHMVAYYCGFLPITFSVSLSHPLPSLSPQSMGTNNVFHQLCWFNLPPATPRVLISLSNVYRLWDMRGEEEGRETEWVIETETKGRKKGEKQERAKAKWSREV